MKSLSKYRRALRCRVGYGLLWMWFCHAQTGWSVTVTEAYQKAFQLYGKGQFKEAFEIATATMQRYPDHQPTYLLAGQIMYRMGKLDRAARFFRKVSPDLLSSELAYVYGVTFFSIGDCTAAETGFSHVTSASAAGKLAAFYRGICFARNRSWTSAEKQLLAATPLPPHLETVRRRALEQVRNALSAERSAPPLTNITYLYVQPPPQYSAATSPGSSAYDGPPPAEIYQSKKQAAPRPTLPPAGFTGAVTPSGEISQKQFLRDYSGYRLEKGMAQTLSGRLGLLGRYNARPNAGGGQPYASIAGDAGLTSTESKGQSSSVIAYSDAPTETTIKSTDLPSGKTDVMRLSINPEVGYPLGGIVDLTVGGRWVDTTLSGASKDKYTRQEGYSAMAFGVNTQIKGTATLIQKLDKAGVNTENAAVFGGQFTHIIGPATITLGGQYASRTQVTKPASGLVFYADEGASTFDGTVSSVDASARKNWDTFSMTAAGSFRMYETSSPAIKKAKEDLSVRVELSAVKTWDIGLSLTVTGSVTQLSDYKLEVEKPSGLTDNGTSLADPAAPEKVVAVATGDESKGLISLKYVPFSLLSFAVSYDAIKAAYQPTEKLLEQKVQAALPSLVTNMTFLAGIQASF